MTDSKASFRAWLAEAAKVVSELPPAPIARAVEALRSVRARGGTIFIAGNGGSASTASHYALDLQKAARKDGVGTRAVSLSDSVGLITAWSNDAAFECVFSEQLRVLAQQGDALVVLSVSGSSPNLLAALRTARERGLVTVGFLGKDGGHARTLVDHAVVVRSDDYGWVECAHLVLGHMLTYALREQPQAAEAKPPAAKALGA